MKKLIILFSAIAVVAGGCKKSSLQVTDLNEPSLDVLKTEVGVVAYAKGFFKIGFGDQVVGSLDDGLGFGNLWIVEGFHEGMGDNIFVPWGNNDYKYVDNPLSVTLDNGTVVANPIGQGQQYEMQLRNSRAYGATNSFLHEWTYMYFLNNSANVLLSQLDVVSFTGNAATKKQILQAWAYWWKGYAYCRLGSMYLAGTIADTANSTNGRFVDHDAMVTEGIANLDKATQIIGSLSAGGDYDALVGLMMPGYMQVPHLPSPTEWARNIATFKARSLLVNKRVKDMAAGDWAAILALVNTGIQASDYAFGIRTADNNSLGIIRNDNALDGSGNGGGSLQSELAGEGNTASVSERSIQDFKSGDKRLSNNFSTLSSTVINLRGRSITFGTRYQLVAGGNGNGAYIYYNQTPGVDNFYVAASYEENALMKAECLIHTSQVDAGLAIIDAIRTYQGAGLAAVSGTGLNETQAAEELRKERRCALLYRGVAFYDLRRMGYADDVSKGGGRKGAVVLDGGGNLNTNATINYSYMSYWDVPQNELDFNAPSSGSATLKNAK